MTRSAEKDKVMAIAEELHKVVIEKVEENILEMVKQTLQGLQEESKETKEVIMGLARTVDSIKSCIMDLNESIKEQTKQQQFERILSNNIHHYVQSADTYFYHVDYVEGECTLLENIVPPIIRRFRVNKGYKITGHSLRKYYRKTKEQIAKGEQDFRDVLSQELLYILGVKPRIALENGQYMIYYS